MAKRTFNKAEHAEPVKKSRLDIRAGLKTNGPSSIVQSVGTEA
jgi:hypothetical protein